MKKKVLLLLVTVITVMSALCLGANAETFYPDTDGKYTVELSMEAGHEYVMFLLKGEYDQTNYIEAYASSSDEDIMYFGSAISDGNGKVTFGPFVPFEYCNATIIVGGTSLDEPYLGGHVNADGFSSSAQIDISGANSLYYVNGELGEDVVINIETSVLDSFGNPSLTGEEVVLSVNDNGKGYAYVSEDGKSVTVSRYSENMVFSITAAAGNAEDTVFVEIKRSLEKANKIEFVSEDETVYESPYTYSYVAGNLPTLTFGIRTLNQFGEETNLGGGVTYTLNGNASTNVVTPTGAGTYTLAAKNEDNVTASLVIEFVEIPDYQGSAKELDEMIKAAEADLALVLEGKSGRHVSVDGKDVYPDENWTTPDEVAEMERSISLMKEYLAKYGEEDETYFRDNVVTFNTVQMIFEASFKGGKRVDAYSVEITTEGLDRVLKQSKPIALSYKMLPLGNTDVLTWSSSDPSIVSVDENGKITTVSYGTATITATTRTGISDSVDVTVWNEITRLEVSANMTVTYGDAYKSFTATPYTDDAAYPPSAKINWRVENPDIVSIKVSEDGKTCTVIPNAVAGSTNIIVTADTFEVTRKVTVKLPADWIMPAIPAANVESGIIYKGTEVSLSCETEGATVYYTLNGEEPTLENSRVYRGTPIAINQSLTLKAFATGEKMFNSEVVTYEYNVVSSAIVMDSLTAQSGETVEVGVYFNDNPGVDNIAFDINFDTSYLTLVGTETQSIAGVEITGTAGDGVYSINAVADNAESLEGKLAILIFTIKAAAVEGEYTLTANVTTESDDVIYSLIETEGGVITVDNVIVGDADDNGKIEIYDVLIIRQFLAGMQSAVDRISFIGADVNADGYITEDDVVLLSKYCVGMDVTLGASINASAENVRIVKNNDLKKVEEGRWINIYELYNPMTGEVETNVAGTAEGVKASSSELRAYVEPGALIALTSDGKVQDIADKKDEYILSDLLADSPMALWVAEYNAEEGSIGVVPADSSEECRQCVADYVETAFADNTEVEDILGNKIVNGSAFATNKILIDEKTSVVCIKQADFGTPGFFKWASMERLNESVLGALNDDYLCYNMNAQDAEGGRIKGYSDYVKVWVSVRPETKAGSNPVADYIIILVNGSEAAAKRADCGNH